MDPATLAGLAVGALVRYVVSKGARLAGRAGRDIDRAVDDRLDRLYDAVAARVAGNRPVERTLHQFEEDPTDDRRQGRLEYALEDLLTTDPDFTARLTALVEGLGAQAPGSVTVRDAGAVALGGDVHQSGRYVAGRDLTIGSDDG
jgi:hypothetical protein